MDWEIQVQKNEEGLEALIGLAIVEKGDLIYECRTVISPLIPTYAVIDCNGHILRYQVGSETGRMIYFMETTMHGLKAYRSAELFAEYQKIQMESWLDNLGKWNL